jgi:hypothetical protein
MFLLWVIWNWNDNYTFLINGWGFHTGESQKKLTDQATTFGIFGTLSFIFLLIPVFSVIAGKNFKINLVFPVISFILSIGIIIVTGLIKYNWHNGIGSILFFLSAIAVTVGVVFSRQDISIGSLLEKFKGGKNA